MRRVLLVASLPFLVAACTDAGPGPTVPILEAPRLQTTHVGGDPATDDLCAGLSPCDAFDYDRDASGAGDGLFGAPGMCLAPPTADNHLGDPACAADGEPGLDGLFQVAWCQIEYADPAVGTVPPSLVGCQDEADWQGLVEEPIVPGLYTASVEWDPRSVDVGSMFRLYVIRGSQHFAFRDVVIDPGQSGPPDHFLLPVGFGTDVKVLITEDFDCLRFDTQAGDPENAASCLITGASTFSFETEEVTATFSFPEGNPPFLAQFEVSECLSLGFSLDESDATIGNALVDTPLADCKISLSSEDLESLTVPGQIELTVNDDRWIGVGGPMNDARLNVLQVDEFGVGALPPTEDPGWFGAATSSSALLRLIDRGLDRLVDVFAPQPLLAFPGAGWDFTRMSDFQVALMPVMEHDMPGGACQEQAPHCLDLGVRTQGTPVPVAVRVTAPPRIGAAPFGAPDTRLHFFPEDGSVVCPSGTEGPLDAFGRGCYPAGTPDQSTVPPSQWDHLVVVTGLDGLGAAEWSLASGENTLRVSACGVARPGAEEPDPPSEPGADGVWGALGDCADRELAMTAGGAFDNGPADGLTPFEPVDLEHEVAIHGLPLTFVADTCPQIAIDGLKGDASGVVEWEECAEKTGFRAPLGGPKNGGDNAWLYTYDDGASLYLGLEIETGDMSKKIFVHLVEQFMNGDGIAAAGDDILVIDLHDPADPSDWHFTEQCTGNNAASLCGDPDASGDGAGLEVSVGASIDGAGPGRVFYELRRPLGSPNAEGPDKEDLAGSTGQQLGLKLTVTQGQGGGKGGFVYPDPRSSEVEYHPFSLR